MTRPRTLKIALIPAAGLALAVSLSGCVFDTSITAGICSDAAALKSSTIALNTNESTGLAGLLKSCDATAGGTVFNGVSIANAILADALLLQQSGLLADVHITAQVPADQKVLKKIKLDARAWLKGA